MSVVGKPGYKETEMGWIPSDWNSASFGSLLSERPAYGANASAEGDGGDGYVRYVRITDIDENGSLIESGKKYVPTVVGKGYLLSDQDILIARTGNTVGKSLLFRASMGEAAFAGYLIRFRVGNSLDCHFVSQFLRSDAYWAWVKGAVKVGAQPNINAQQYQSMLLPLPPLPEQQKIAAILTVVDDKLDVIAHQIAASKTLKQGLMKTLFSRGVGTQDANGRWAPHSEFKDSDLGEIPVGWSVATVGDVCEVKGGKRLPKGELLTEENTGFPYIRVTDMYMGGVKTEAILYVPTHVQPTIARYTISKDDIFISVAGTLGLVGVVPDQLDGANLTENADKLTDIKINRDYLLHYLCSDSIQASIARATTSNAQPKLALTRIREFLLPLPSQLEQEHIANILRATDQKLSLLGSKKSHYQTLKRGLMQKLLTGEWRVKLESPTASV